MSKLITSEALKLIVRKVKEMISGKADKDHIHKYSEISGTPNIPVKISDIDNDLEFQTKTQVEQAINEASLGNEVDLSDYATDEELTSALLTKADKEHTHSQYLTSGSIANKSDVGHGHEISEIENLENRLQTKANVSHSHNANNIEWSSATIATQATNVQGAIEQLAVYSQELVGSKADKNHTHSYNDLTNKPTIPTKVSELTNDSGFVTADEIPEVSVDTSNLITKTEFTAKMLGKSDTDHVHEEYLTIDDIANKSDVGHTHDYLSGELTTTEDIDTIWNNS